MPLSEFYRIGKGNPESAQQKSTTTSTDLSYLPDNEFVELVWENGHIMTQGQSSRVKKSTDFHNTSSPTQRILDKDAGNARNSRLTKFGAMDSNSNNFLPQGEMGLDQEDDMVPWLHYPIDDTLGHDYSGLLPELSSVTANELSAFGKRNSSNQAFVDLRNVSTHSLNLEQQKVSASQHDGLTRSGSGQLYPGSSQHRQTSLPSLRSGVSGISTGNTLNMHHAICGNSVQGHTSTNGSSSMSIQKKDIGAANANPGFINFSHFARPASLMRANLHNFGANSTPGSSGSPRMGNKDKESGPSGSNRAESIDIDLSSSRKKFEIYSQSNLVSEKVESKPSVSKRLDESYPAEQIEAVCQGNGNRDNVGPNPRASPAKGMPSGEKTLEPVVASSSVCSGNSADGASNDMSHNLKRKFQETDDSEYRSEQDVEEESVGVRKTASARGGTSSKRSRAAEVHNLSERRRRDRINEKMRALQELIPNCNKVDKASMLDEAIEYLKTLQLQVQIMSMGAGMYMPHMMFPAGMQHVHAAHMTHFSSMGVGMGMGMGMGYSMGMVDMNNVPHMQGPRLPAPSMSSSNSFQGHGGSNFPGFGHPGQVYPLPMPRPPLVPFTSGPPVSSAEVVNSSRPPVPAELPVSAPTLSPKDLMQNANSNVMHNADASSSMNQTSGQGYATNEGFNLPAPVVRKDQAPD